MKEHTEIRETPIGNLHRKDILVWAANRNGSYSVISGYLWLQLQSLSLRDHHHLHSNCSREALEGYLEGEGAAKDSPLLMEYFAKCHSNDDEAV